MTHSCTICQREDAWAEFGQACTRCRDRTAAALRAIPPLAVELAGLGYVERDLREGTRAERHGAVIVRVAGAPADPVAHLLTAGPLNGASTGARVSGSPHPSVPSNLHVVDLLAPSRPASRPLYARGLLGLDDDQTGTLSAATILDTWVRDWASRRNEGLPHPQVPLLCSWLRDRLDWACSDHPAVDEFAAEIQDLRNALTAAAGRFDARPEILTTPCPSSGMLTLYRDRDIERIACGCCSVLMTEDDYATYLRQLIEAAMSTTGHQEAFNDVVLAWLKQRCPAAESIEALETYGTDWAGDTEGGFYSEFEFTIRYLTAAGTKERLEVKGEAMGDLWMHVMRSWPAPGDAP